MRFAVFNCTTVLSAVMVFCFIGHLPLVFGLVTRRGRGWKRAAWWFCLACWLALVVAVTLALRGTFEHRL